MKKLLLCLAALFAAITINAQESNSAGLVIAKADFTGVTEFNGWVQFDDSQTDGKVECTDDGLAITVGIQDGKLWHPQIMVIPDGSFDLEEGGDYKVVITAKFPSDGTLGVDMGSWSANDLNEFPIKATGDFQEVECQFEGWAVNTEDAHLILYCGDFNGKTIIKSIKVVNISDCGIPTIIYYNYIKKGKAAEVIHHNYYGAVIIPESVMYEGEEYTVTKIGDSAFSGCSKLTSITIPNSVTNIGNNAFAECIGLTSLNIPNSVTNIGDFAFQSCCGLRSLIIPTSVTSIGQSSFIGCIGLTSLNIPNSVIIISDGAFEGCSGLTSLNIPNSVTKIGSYSFRNCSSLTSLTIPNSVTSIGDDAFMWCSGLISLNIPNSVTSIGDYAFSGCSSLTSLTISNSVTNIGNNAFANCRGLTSLTIPNSVTSIGNQAFYNCSGLTSLTIPNSVTSIGNQAFYNCSGLTSLTIPNSVTSIGNKAFYICSGLTSLTIPNSVTSIGDQAFFACTELTSLTIPNSMTSIGNGAFYSCTGLTSLTIPNSVTSIGGSAFQDCSGLTTITIGSGVKRIDGSAFGNCPELTDVFCMAEELSSSNSWDQVGLYAASNAFEGSYIEFATLHVPATALKAYQTTEPWKNFKQIVAIGNSEIPETQKCATPTIKYENGKITFSCETEGVAFISNITPAEINKKYDSEIVISNTYTVTVYATKIGYINSDKASIEIQANSGIMGDLTGDGEVNAADAVKLVDIIMGKK